MLEHIERVKFILLLVDKNKFNHIFKYKTTQIKLPNNAEWQAKLLEKNEFIRFKYKDWYMDVTIHKIVKKKAFTIELGKVIDYHTYNLNLKQWLKKKK